MPFEEVGFGRVTVHLSTFVGSGPKFTEFVASKFAEGIALHHSVARYSIYSSVLEIFAIKVQSCLKLRQILHDLVPRFFFFWGGRAPKFCDIYF